MRFVALLLALYITSDFGSAFLPGAFAFDPDESVEAISKVSFASETEASPALQNAAAWRVDDRPGNARAPRQLVRSRARPVVIQAVHSTAPHRDAPTPADDDHQR